MYYLLLYCASKPLRHFMSIRILLTWELALIFVKNSAAVSFPGSPKTRKCDKWLSSRTYRLDIWHKLDLLMTLKGVRIAPRDPRHRSTPHPLHPLHATYISVRHFSFYMTPTFFCIKRGNNYMYLKCENCCRKFYACWC